MTNTHHPYISDATFNFVRTVTKVFLLALHAIDDEYTSVLTGAMIDVCPPRDAMARIETMHGDRVHGLHHEWFDHEIGGEG